jgi:uncharacterized protein (TIGR01244 family)
MFRQLTERVYASPQIGTDQVADAKALGVALIINNRPEGESDDQTPGPEIAAAAQAAGIDYLAIPVAPGGFSQEQVDAMREALGKAGDAPVLAYCRSGTRSTLLWALAEASAGVDLASLREAAAGAGYDLASIAPLMDRLAARAR